MTQLWGEETRHRINNAVRVLCPIIDERIKARVLAPWDEQGLRKELVACILGSQVRHEMAVTAMRNLESAGLLDNLWWAPQACDEFSSNVHAVLNGQWLDLPCPGRYRFPKARAAQLARARDQLARLSLETRLISTQDSKELRYQLVADISGLGPKQASMFLRNIGKSYDLAILDTHVLRFLDMQDGIPSRHAALGTVKGYEAIEDAVVGYADTLGYPPGYLDWAIWATMKAARELAL
jgi:N-glycosylase/DNA lyase